MRIDNLFQFLVPLTFLAIWALAWLFNRDAQPLPPRPGRSSDPDGSPRPSDPLSGRGPYDRVGSRSMPEPARPMPRRPGPSNTEEILVIEGDPRAKNPFRTVANASRRMARGRTGSTPPKAGRERGRSASDSGGPTSTLASQMALPESLTPLSSNISSPLLPGGKLLDAHTRTTDRTTDHPRAVSSIISRIGNRESLRDAFVMAEILRPPVALRRGPLRISRPR